MTSIKDPKYLRDIEIAALMLAQASEELVDLAKAVRDKKPMPIQLSTVVSHTLEKVWKALSRIAKDPEI